MLESKTASASARGSCEINVRPQTLPRCGGSASASNGCFDVGDGTLQFQYVQGLFTGDGILSYGPRSTFSKISD